MNVGQIVTILDLEIPMTGIITRDDRGVYRVTTLSGLNWAREEIDLAPATEEAAAKFTRDLKILAPHHADLAEAFAQVITPMDTVVPGTLLKDIPLSTRMPSGNVITRREVAAEMIRSSVRRPAIAPVAHFPRSVTELV